MNREDLKPRAWYRLNSDVVNPLGDKRRKYASALDRNPITAGVRFRAETERDVVIDALSNPIDADKYDDTRVVSISDGRARLWLKHEMLNGGESEKELANRRALVTQILAHLEQIDESWETFCLDAYVNETEIARTVEWAIDKGRLKLDDMKALVIAWRADEED